MITFLCICGLSLCKGHKSLSVTPSKVINSSHLLIPLLPKGLEVTAR